MEMGLRSQSPLGALRNVVGFALRTFIPNCKRAVHLCTVHLCTSAGFVPIRTGMGLSRAATQWPAAQLVAARSRGAPQTRSCRRLSLRPHTRLEAKAVFPVHAGSLNV